MCNLSSFREDLTTLVEGWSWLFNIPNNIKTDNHCEGYNLPGEICLSVCLSPSVYLCVSLSVSLSLSLSLIHSSRYLHRQHYLRIRFTSTSPCPAPKFGDQSFLTHYCPRRCSLKLRVEWRNIWCALKNKNSTLPTTIEGFIAKRM